MAILRVHPGHPERALLSAIGRDMVKCADDPTVAYNLAGRLYLSQSGWLLLSVPNAIARSFFLAMHEPGIELPPGYNDEPFNAHITVMRPEELDALGGADRISERGKQFHYTIGRLYHMEPDNWPGIDRIWFLRVHSPELQALRSSYGLSPLPNEGKHAFHVTVACRRRGVLARGATAKS